MRKKSRTGHVLCLDDPKSVVAEAFRTLRTNIQFAGVNRELRSLLVTSSGAGEGKTTTFVNLGLVMAQADQQVLLIDADLRKPSLHKRLPVANHAGLSNLLIRQASFLDVVQEVRDVPGLFVVTAGLIPPNPADLLSSQRMREFLAQVEQQFDMVLIDSPPLLPCTDAQVLARQVDGVLLVVCSGTTVRDHAKKALSLVEHVGGHVIGTVLNNKKVKAVTYY